LFRKLDVTSKRKDRPATIKLDLKKSKIQGKIPTIGQTFYRHDSRPLRVLIFHPSHKKIRNSGNPQLAHLQATQANTQTKACKRANSPPALFVILMITLNL